MKQNNPYKHVLCFRKMKILVTGGAGFIGSWVVDKLLEKGHEVAVIDNLSTGRRENLNAKARFYEIDIRDKNLFEIFERENFDYVFHLAAQINLRDSIKNPLNDCEINIIGSLNVIECSVKYKIKKIVFSSSGGAMYGDDIKMPTPETEKENPLSPYGIAKLSVEKYLNSFKEIYGLDYAALRYSNVYGPRQNAKGEAGVVCLFIDKMLSGEQIVINGSGEQTRDFVYVEDVADANVLALNLSRIFNVSTGIETSINEIFRKIKNEIGREVKETHGEEIAGELKRSCLSSEKLQREGWKMNYDLDKGIGETVGWFKREKNLA